MRPVPAASPRTAKAPTAPTPRRCAQIGEQGVAIEQALKQVTIRVRSLTKGRHEPWMEGSLTGDFYFILSGLTQVTIQQAAEGADRVAAFRAYLGEYLKGLYAAAARIKLASLDAAARQTGMPAAAASTTRPICRNFPRAVPPRLRVAGSRSCRPMPPSSRHCRPTSSSASPTNSASWSCHARSAARPNRRRCEPPRSANSAWPGSMPATS